MPDDDNDFYKKIRLIDKVEPNDIELINEIKLHIAKLQHSHDAFIKKAVQKGYNPKELAIAETEIQIFTLIKFLSEKIGLQTDNYDKKIKEIRIQHLGKDFINANDK